VISWHASDLWPDAYLGLDGSQLDKTFKALGAGAVILWNFDQGTCEFQALLGMGRN
jgi:hypothetical protein